MHLTLADGKSTNTTHKQDKLLVVKYVKFHLTMFKIVFFIKAASWCFLLQVQHKIKKNMFKFI